MATRKEVLTAQLRNIADELARLETRPAEPLGEYPTVGFTIRFADSGGRIPFTYAARKARGTWWTTGRGDTGMRRSLTWDQLLDWIDDKNVGGLATSALQVYESARSLLVALPGQETRPPRAWEHCSDHRLHPEHQQVSGTWCWGTGTAEPPVYLLSPGDAFRGDSR